MFDINFFKNSFDIKKKIVNRKFSEKDYKIIESELEDLRSKSPTIFNIETTNYCNMKCVMCPRTIYMTRKNIWIDDDTFEKMLNKIKPYNKNEMENFWDWKSCPDRLNTSL